MIKIFQIVVLALTTSFVSFAEDNPDAALGMGPCMQDAQKLCPGIIPGKGSIRECLKNNWDKVTPECKEKMEKKKEEVKEKMKDLHEVCKTEVEQFCGNIKKGKGKIIKCLHEKKSEAGFGEDCKKELEALPHRGKRK